MNVTPPNPEIDPQAWSRLAPHVRQLLQRIYRKPRPAMESLPSDLAREAYALGSDVLEIPVRELPRVESMRIPTRDGYTIEARLYAPKPAGGAALPVLVFFHGGGFVVGSVETHDRLCRELAFLSGCAVWSVDYRLAPEHRFPTAFNDCWDSIFWLRQRGKQLGLNVDKLAVGGDSAGGTLAAACAVQAAHDGVPIQLQLVLYPGMQVEPITPSRQQYAQGFLLTEPQIQWMFNNYVRTPEDFADWRFAPIFADDIDHIAPAWIGIAECDPVADDSLLWADKLRSAGVAVELEVYHGMIHEFVKMGHAIPEARKAHVDMANALKQALQPES